MHNIDYLRTKIEQAKGQRGLLQKQLKGRMSDLAACNQLQKAQEAVQLLIQHTAKETQDQLKFHIQAIVQSALDVCFPGVYYFVIEFESKRNRTECSMYVDKDNERMNPLDSNGGGLVDLIAFALRIAALGLSTFDKVILLDEPFKFLSDNLKPVAAELMKKMSHTMGIQLIIVTHDDEITATADKVFKVTQKKRRSIVEEV